MRNDVSQLQKTTTTQTRIGFEEKKRKKRTEYFAACINKTDVSLKKPTRLTHFGANQTGSGHFRTTGKILAQTKKSRQTDRKKKVAGNCSRFVSRRN